MVGTHEYAIHGLEGRSIDDPYSDSGIGHYLIVEYNAELIRIPVRWVQTEYFKISGQPRKVPDILSFDRVYINTDGQLRADTYLGDGTLFELIPTGNRHDRGWRIEATAPSIEDHTGRVDSGEGRIAEEIWRNSLKTKNEITALIEEGLTPEEALDYWMVEFNGEEANEWAQTRDVSLLEVGNNMENAWDKISGDT